MALRAESMHAGIMHEGTVQVSCKLSCKLSCKHCKLPLQWLLSQGM